jgi:nitroreductase
MDVIDAIRKRKSIRGYKPDPVSRKVLEEILEIATRAPSSMNTQPWQIAVLAGDVLDNIRKGNVEMLKAGKMPEKDIPYKPYEGIYKQRQVDLAKDLFQVLGIAREDREKRDAWMQQGFRFFDAPAAIVLSVDASTDPPTAFSDVGGLTQTICLTALKFGLGTCIMGQGIMYPEVVRRFAPVPESHRMYLCITIGYPDETAAANKIESKREPLANNTAWYGFA